MNRILLFIPAAVLILTSCSSRERTAVTGYNYNNTSKVNQNSQSPVEYEDASNSDRKVVYNASMEMENINPDTVNTSLLDIAHRNGGYVLKTGPDMSSIRIRSENLRQVLNEIALLGNVRNQKIWGNDITEEFNDLAIKLDNLKKARNRYLELLQKATNVEETLKVEKELERLSSQIDMIEGKINRLSHLTAYSTIDVYYRSKQVEHKLKPGPLGYVFIGLYKGVKWLFVRG